MHQINLDMPNTHAGSCGATCTRANCSSRQFASADSSAENNFQLCFRCSATRSRPKFPPAIDEKNKLHSEVRAQLPQLQLHHNTWRLRVQINLVMAVRRQSFISTWSTSETVFWCRKLGPPRARTNTPPRIFTSHDRQKVRWIFIRILYIRSATNTRA